MSVPTSNSRNNELPRIIVHLKIWTADEERVLTLSHGLCNCDSYFVHKLLSVVIWQRPVFILTYPQQTCENFNSIGPRRCEIIMEEKHPCHMKLYALSPKSNSDVSKSNSWKITSFSKTIPYFRGSRFILSKAPNITPSK